MPVKIRINTPLTAFENDIADVVRLFYGEGAATTYDEICDGVLVHEHVLEHGVWSETFELTIGDASIKRSISADACLDGGLEEKRQLKRLVKRCCYQLFKEHTGRTPVASGSSVPV